MKVSVNNEQTRNVNLYYEESFWTGKRIVKYNGVELTKVGNGLYEYKNDNFVEYFEVNGNFLFGVVIKMFNNNVEITRKLTWYEVIMSIIVFIPCILFGLIGGCIGGIIAATNLVIIKQIEKVYLKVIISTEFFVIGALLSYVLAVLVFR